MDEVTDIDKLIEKIGRWRKERNDDINDNYAGRSLLEVTVIVATVQSLMDDMDMLLRWCEVLAGRVKDIEGKVKE